ncbi:DUF6705 family protein [Chryseobacterium sp. IT-36CA2]|uniref:DUF6705 family protein n=1 Tax=Chryseobacterium sp. IT-36CA2 TaxID=3026460 RepID=UPI0039E0B3B5
MKNLFLMTTFFIGVFCKSQTYPLTETELPENSYRKDINNELPVFEGNWKGIWNGKTFLINFKKMTNQYNNVLKIYNDQLVGKFQVKDSSGNILFDNLTISDSEAKIKGGKMYSNGAYLLTYLDPDLCLKSGFIKISFTNSAKTEMKFKFMEGSQLLDSECFYRGKPADQRPEPLPKEIILTKQ